MNEWEALDQFWNSFDLEAYDENTVPDDIEFPYITYEAIVGRFDNKIPLSASLWYRTTSWESISLKALEIGRAIGGGYGVAYNNGRLWITAEEQFMNRRSDPVDLQIRRIELRINAEFQTAE